jgi:hypothetical protein
MAEIWGAAIIAGGAVAGAAISANGAKSAANAQSNAQQAGINAQMSMFNTTQQNFAPQVQLGQGAANMLGGIYGIGGVTGGTNGTTTGSSSPNYAAFYNSPGYQFALSQGEGAINKQAAASGNLYSSNTLGAVNNYAQGQASSQYNSYINQLTTMAGLGNAASAGTATAGTATGQGVANSYGNIGNAQANGILGQSNAFTNALGAVGSQGGNLMNGYSAPAYSAGSQYNTYTGADGTLPGGQFTSTGEYCDYGLKKNIEPYRFNGMSNLQVYDFHYKTQDDSEDKHRGYIAQEVLEQYPEAVSVGPKGFLMVDYSKLPGWDELDEIGSTQNG